MRFLILLLSASPVFASGLAVYGDDNRQDVYAVKNELFKHISIATAAMIDEKHLKVEGPRTTITAKNYRDTYNLCPNERFQEQPAAANCSGTLVAPDLIMTAAHCYDQQVATCNSYRWVFDYKVETEKQSSVTVDSDNVYECDKVVFWQMDLDKGIDHALIKLKRPVTDRGPAILRSSGSIKKGEALVLIGHPRGLPTKIADDAYVLSVDKNSFVSNVDAFSVNSGSGVFNAKTGEVEGILSSGPMDFDMETCTSTRVLPMDQGMDTSIKIDGVRKFLKRYRP